MNDIIVIINISDKFRICIALLITLLSNWKCQFGQLVIFSDDLPVTKGEVYIKACRNDESYCQQLSVERCKDDFLFYIRHTRECDEAYCIGCILMYMWVHTTHTSTTSELIYLAVALILVSRTRNVFFSNNTSSVPLFYLFDETCLDGQYYEAKNSNSDYF